MKKRKMFIAAALLLLAWICGILYGNRHITVSAYTMEDPLIPDAFDGCVLLQVSDLHNAVFGKENARLLAVMEEQTPDYIFVTGDILDSRRTDVDIAADFLTRAVQIAPVFYVTGNHESRIPAEFAELLSVMEEIGVTVLRDNFMLLTNSGEAIRLIGLEDPAFSGIDEDWTLMLLSALASEDFYTVVLSHRPELFEGYCDTEADLVFTGHAHGGQFRIPGIGGFFAPNQGFFPEYTEGIHTRNGTAMVVSRGLGNSLFPFRVMNPPEIVTVTLKQA